MDHGAWAWVPVFVTVGVLLAYEVWLFVAQRLRPERWARSAHATLREAWFAAVSAQPGSEILAVQTLRNSLMSATMTASTAALGLMGTVTLAAPSLHEAFAGMGRGAAPFTPRLALELVLLALLFASLVSSVVAVRYYNHVGFVGGMPVNSPARKQWHTAGMAYVRKAGVLYSVGLRQLVLVAPVVASILYPAAGPVAAMLVVAVLLRMDRFQATDEAAAGLD
ncbi:DUF599 domain-containing protein [Azohydromonas caseinilytica]|uniref:DUF599 domain-containing protein n=1 Tax=Azohydromonas caseinilytica TaxID=2728836 RepID=A0A848FIS4_9BURK|nr:DUF599 domain-containing protein [Azohydromonas caseinilytica]NML18179.1 DUF599 domain-containing protein [Azohydromonas caseinilytica]